MCFKWQTGDCTLRLFYFQSFEERREIVGAKTSHQLKQFCHLESFVFVIINFNDIYFFYTFGVTIFIKRIGIMFNF